MSDIAEVLIRDRNASKNDGELLLRFVEAGKADRAGLDAALGVISGSDLDPAKKRPAERTVRSYLDRTARGIAADLYALPATTAARFEREGIDSSAKLLERAATPAQRAVLAGQLGLEEKALTALVKQADLARLEAVDPRLAKVLVGAGVDSVKELRRRNAGALHRSLSAFAATHDAYVMGFRMPETRGEGTKRDRQIAALQTMITQAREAPLVLELGSAIDGYERLTRAEKIEMLRDHPALNTEEYPGEAAALFRELGVETMLPKLTELRRDAMGELSDALDVWDIRVGVDALMAMSSYDDLLAHVTPEESEALGNGWASFSPTVETVKSEDRLIGVKLTWTNTLDGDHSYGRTYFYDHAEKKLIGDEYSGYETDTETNVYDD